MHNFAVNPDVHVPRSQFNMPFGHKTTGDAGWLIPIFWQFMLPGDTINLNPTLFARMATPSFPIMDNMFLDIQHFFVPTRQYFDNYRKFHGEQNNPGDSIDFTIPILSGTQNSSGDGDLTTTAGRTSVLLNYLGVPESIDASDVDINAELTRCYAHIYNHWYRDQNLIDSVPFDTDDGPDLDTDYMLQRRGKRFDYFTQMLPSPQRGGAVTLPLGTSAPVESTGTGVPEFNLPSYDNNPVELQGWAALGGQPQITWEQAGNDAAGFTFEGAQWDTTSLEANLTSATAATWNDIREAAQVQVLLEKDARAGTRLPEVIRGHFGVDFMDITYRPEFLGGGSEMININQVLATAQENFSGDPNNRVGDTGAFSTTVSRGKGFTKSFTEHGVVMSIMSVRADLTYQEGLNRFFSLQTRYDTAYPVLAHLGEQAVLSKEIFCDGTAGDEDVLGYVPRYDHYRYNISRISGKFTSRSATPLDSWHLSQEFGTRPVLGQTFIEENPPLDRVINVSSEPHFIFDTYFDVKCARVLPTFGIPGKVDHF